MVRMLGFSEEEKQTIGLAQNNSGKGVVRGVLGLPGRLVGGIVGGSSPGKSTQASQDSQVGSIFSITLLSSFTTLFFSRQSPSVFFITSHHVDRYQITNTHCGTFYAVICRPMGRLSAQGDRRKGETKGEKRSFRSRQAVTGREPNNH
jgi:hypothetical protein